MNFDTKYWFLHNHQLFDILSSDDLREICFVSSFKTARKGEMIYFAHDETSRLYTIKKGTIKIVETDEKGNEIVKDILQKGDLFGQLSYSENGQNQNEHAVVVSDSFTCCSFQLHEFEKLLEQKAGLAIKYTKWVGFRLKKIENRYQNLMFRDVKARLIVFLKEWTEKDGKVEGNTIILKNYLTHQDIASLICSTRQTVTQLFNELRDKGCIDYSRTEIVVHNLNQ